jgi:hypothetical protein
MNNQEKLERYQKAQVKIQDMIDNLCLEAKDLENDKKIDDDTHPDSPLIFTQESHNRLIEIGKQVTDLNKQLSDLKTKSDTDNFKKDKPSLLERLKVYGKRKQETTPTK